MTAPPATSGTSNQRIQRYGPTFTALSLLSNRQLGRLLPPMRSTAARRMSSATPLSGHGIGGTSALLDMDGTPVFAKRIPLTDLERRATR